MSKNGKPKGRMSAYTFFVQSTRNDQKAKNPGSTVAFAEFSKLCGEKWKNMNEKAKKKFQDLADGDKKRFDSEMKKYVPPNDDGGKGGKKRKKDPNAPKKSLSSFFLYSRDQRPKLKASNPDLTPTEVVKELGRSWKAVAPEVKTKYENQAKRDKENYEKEKSSYDKRAKSQVEVPEDVEEEEEEEESDEEEDD